MKDKFLKAKQIKRILQMKKKLADLCREYNFGMYSDRGYNMHVEVKEFNYISNIFHIKPTVTNNYSLSYDRKAEIYLEGLCIFCIYNSSDDVIFDWKVDSLNKKFKELYCETEDKEKAFELLKQQELERLRKPYVENYGYKTEGKLRREPIYWINTYDEFKKYLYRHSSQDDNYETRYSKYQLYKINFVNIDKEYESDLTYSDAERKRPNYDWYTPMTFKQWNKANY